LKQAKEKKPPKLKILRYLEKITEKPRNGMKKAYIHQRQQQV